MNTGILGRQQLKEDTNNFLKINQNIISRDIFRKYNGFEYFDELNKSPIDKSEIFFHEQCNESIFIIKLSNPDEIILDSFVTTINITSNGIQQSTGAYVISCQVYDGINGSGLEPLWIASYDDVEIDVRLRYLQYHLGNILNFTFDNRTLDSYDNESLFSETLWYPWSPEIPPGEWYFVFSAVFPDLEQSDFKPRWEVWMNLSGNCSNVTITTGEGGTVYGLWYGEYDANVIISKTSRLEWMINGKKSFHIKNTFFYWFEAYIWERGYFRVKWSTPYWNKSFTMLLIRGRYLYDEDNIDGCVWGMGGSGRYDLILNYMDIGFDLINYPLFIGLDIELP